MATVDVHEAKTHLSALLRRASGGEQIIIARAGQPIAMLGPITTPFAQEREPGLLKGRIRFERDFDAPMTESALTIFYEEPVEPE